RVFVLLHLYISSFLLYIMAMPRTLLAKKLNTMFSGLAFDILTPPDEKMGDYSVNIPFLLAKHEKTDPFKKAEQLAEELKADGELCLVFSKIEAAKPGYVNFTIHEDHLRNSIK